MERPFNGMGVSAPCAEAIAKGENEFEVDGKKYPVKGVDKKDKENAKKFTNESKSMKLKDLLKLWTSIIQKDFLLTNVDGTFVKVEPMTKNNSYASNTGNISDLANFSLNFTHVQNADHSKNESNQNFISLFYKKSY